jgi:hypothetical protein
VPDDVERRTGSRLIGFAGGGAPEERGIEMEAREMLPATYLKFQAHVWSKRKHAKEKQGGEEAPQIEHPEALRSASLSRFIEEDGEASQISPQAL